MDGAGRPEDPPAPINLARFCDGETGGESDGSSMTNAFLFINLNGIVDGAPVWDVVGLEVSMFCVALRSSAQPLKTLEIVG